jgi:hypothetical protein
VAGPACSLQRSGSLWQLGIEAQELTAAIFQLAEQLEADNPEQRASALAELEAALLAEEGNKAALAAKADGPRPRNWCKSLGLSPGVAGAERPHL